VKEAHSPNPRVFWSLAAAGIAIMGFGIYGLMLNAERTQPGQWVRWFVGSAIAHDFVLAPVVAIGGWLVARSIPGRYRATVNGALIASGIVILVAYPFVRAYGASESNPSALPNDYALGLLGILATIWVPAGLMLWRKLRN